MENNSKHATDCKMVFGRKDANCPRCQALLAGAKPRDGWQKRYFAAKQDRMDDIRAHFTSHMHLSGGCGVVCTYGDC